MTRYSKKNGKYNIAGSNYEMLSGTRAQVWHGTAYKTSGGLTKKNLFQNKNGRIVSKSKHSSAKRENRLIKNGYGTKKGHFGFVKLNGTSKKGRSKKMRGGQAYGNSFSPASFSGNGIDGQGLTDYGNSSIGVQLAAGMSGGRRRRKGRGRGSRRMRGGDVYGNSLNPSLVSGSGIDGQGMTNYGNSSIDVQMAAGQAGGRRRRRGSKRRGSRSRRMRGGTTSKIPYISPSNPLNRALGAS
jgi:hypothetical protein